VTTNSDTIDIDGIGPILLQTSRRAKRVVISVRISEGVRVAVPTRTSFKKALEFVYLKKEWVQRSLVKIEQVEKRNRVFRDASLLINEADANKRLKDRLYYLANEHGFKYNRASVRNQRTRWGSCSHKNNISLNAKLVLLPKELIDYVILHELVHTRIHNHSKQFWVELDRYAVNGKVMAKRLREYRVRLL
jgi:hypothetical protein